MFGLIVKEGVNVEVGEGFDGVFFVEVIFGFFGNFFEFCGID